MRFRKKPVVIEAIRVSDAIGDATVTRRLPEPWLVAANERGDLLFHHNHVEIRTLEGVMRGELDDWIIRGVKGELYPCKPDIFAATYEAANESGVSLISSERQRQIEQEGWSPEHDAEHTDGSLVEAAVMYARYGAGPLHPRESPPLGCPWSPGWWKPTPGNPVRALVKAGALIAAEIDRRLRKAEPING